jgi:hypothetical protein
MMIIIFELWVRSEGTLVLNNARNNYLCAIRGDGESRFSDSNANNEGFLIGELEPVANNEIARA